MPNAYVQMPIVEPAPWPVPSRGRIGMVFLITTETALFSIFVIAYLFYIGKNVSGPYPADVLELPLVATGCLLSSSVTIMLAERALRHGQERRFSLWWLLTILLGTEFLHQTAVEWSRLIFVDGLTIATNVFGTTFYSLLGLHASHVVVGLLLLLLVFIANVVGCVLHTHIERIAVLAWYWHFVDAVWGIVFTVVYIIGR